MRILFRAPNWLGDAVFSLALLEKLAEKNDITVAVKENLGELFFAQYEVITFRTKRELFLKSLKLKNYEAYLVVPLSFSSAFAAFLTGAPKRVGFAFDSRNFLLTDTIPIPPDWKLKHTMWTYIRLLEPFDIKLKEVPVPHFKITEEDIERSEELLKRKDLESDFVAVAPFTAFGTAKEWGEENFKNLARFLSKQNIQMVILGSLKEKKRAEKIEGDNVVNLCGETTLRMAAYIAKKAIAFVGNDSGLTHLAAASGAKTVAIFGSTSPAWTSPLGKDVTIIYRPPPCSPCEKRVCPLDTKVCMKTITPEEVFQKIIS